MKRIAKHITIFIIMMMMAVSNSFGQNLIPLNKGIDKPVLASCTNNNNLYVIFQTYDLALHERFKVGKWNGLYWTYYPEFNAPSIGSILNSGLNPRYTISSIAFYKNTLYIGGKIEDATLKSKTDHLFKWNGLEWLNVKNAISTNNKGINKMVVYHDKLYIAGSFDRANNGIASNIVTYNGIKWEPVGAPKSQYQGANGEVLDMAIINDELYITGEFSHVAGLQTRNIAWWTGTKWGGIGSPFSEYCNKVFKYKGEIYAYGYSNLNQGDLFKFTGTGWINFNHILSDFPNNNVVDVMEIDNQLWFSGKFTKSGQTFSLISYDGTTATSFNQLSNWTNINIQNLNNNLILTGEFEDINSPNIKNVAQYDENQIKICGKLFIDYNSDCILNKKEILIPNQLVRFKMPNGKIGHTLSDSKGYYEIYGIAGAYEIELVAKEYYNNTCKKKMATLMAGESKFDLNFGMKPIPLQKDLRITSSSLSGKFLKTNQSQVFYIKIINKGTTIERDVIVIAKHDYRMLDFKAEPAEYEYLDNQAKWKIPVINPGESVQIKITLLIAPLIDGTKLEFTTNFENYTDLEPKDNKSTYTYEAGQNNENRSAWKDVSPEGKFTKETDHFDYSIHYRNMSQRIVTRVVITDTFDTHLDVEKYVLTNGSSEPDVRTIGSIVILTFNGLNILPFNKHKNKSQGFLSYRTNLNNNLPIGTVIRNTAIVDMELGDIYRSNTTKNVKDEFRSIDKVKKEPFKITPNPTKNLIYIHYPLKYNSEIYISDISGKFIGKYKNNTIDVSILKAGIYFVKIGELTTKFIKL